MIKIELIKFEAQDVITVSETKPTSVKPSTIVPMARCICQPSDTHRGDWWPNMPGGEWEYHGNCTFQGSHICDID